MFYKFGVCVFALTLLFLAPSSPVSVSTAIEDDSKASDVFGYRSAYVEVYYDSGTKPIKFYDARVSSHHGGPYLIGKSSPENHFKTYAIPLDRIRLMTFPNPKFQREAVEPVPQVEKSLASVVKDLRQEFQQAARRLNDINKVISRKNKQINSAERRSNDANDEEMAKRLQVQLKMLHEELEIHTKERERMQQVVNEAEMNYVRKRHEAVVQGVYSKSMDGL